MINTTSRSEFLNALDIVLTHFREMHKDACKDADECGSDIGLYKRAIELGALLEYLREAQNVCLEGTIEDIIEDTKY